MTFNIRATRKTKVSAPRAKASGLSQFAHATEPRVQPLKTRIYTKGVLQEDPSSFANFGFGETGLRSTPSLLGMSRKPSKR